MDIFLDENDRVRFLFLIIYFQSPIIWNHIERHIGNFLRTGEYGVDASTIADITKDRYIDLIGFTFLPRGFNLVVRELRHGGISHYMQRVLNSYAKYFNTKYKRKGHLFSGPYKIERVEDDDTLLYLTAYLHKKSKLEIEWRGREMLYPWSSYQDYGKANRWSSLLRTEVFKKSYGEAKQYKKFVESIKTKLLEEKVPFKHRI